MLRVIIPNDRYWLKTSSTKNITSWDGVKVYLSKVLPLSNLNGVPYKSTSGLNRFEILEEVLSTFNNKDHILFVDSDDILSEDYLKDVRSLEKDVVYYSDAYRIIPASTVKENKDYAFKENMRKEWTMNNTKDIAEMLKGEKNVHAHMWGWFYPVSLVKKVFKIFKEKVDKEDWASLWEDLVWQSIVSTIDYPIKKREVGSYLYIDDRRDTNRLTANPRNTEAINNLTTAHEILGTQDTPSLNGILSVRLLIGAREGIIPNNIIKAMSVIKIPEDTDIRSLYSEYSGIRRSFSRNDAKKYLSNYTTVPLKEIFG